MPRCIVWRFINRKIDYDGYSIYIMQGDAYKLRTEDIARIETAVNARVQDITKKSLTETIRSLGIENLKLTPSEEVNVLNACPA